MKPMPVTCRRPGSIDRPTATRRALSRRRIVERNECNEHGNYAAAAAPLRSSESGSCCNLYISCAPLGLSFCLLANLRLRKRPLRISGATRSGLPQWPPAMPKPKIGQPKCHGRMPTFSLPRRISAALRRGRYCIAQGAHSSSQTWVVVVNSGCAQCCRRLRARGRPPPVQLKFDSTYSSGCEPWPLGSLHRVNAAHEERREINMANSEDK